MSWIEAIDQRVVALVALLLQLAAAEVGWRIGVRRLVDPDERFQASAVQAAILALLGLLLAFNFSMAAERYDDRRDLAVQESGAIGTVYLRAAFLPEAERDAVRGLLREYVDARVALFEARDPARVSAAIQASEGILGKLWSRVTEPSGADPAHLPLASLVDGMNLVIDLHAAHVAAYEARIPPRILGLLVTVATAGLGTVGWCFGLARGRHRGPCALLALLVTIILLVIIDLDDPTRGRIRVDQQSVRHLRGELSGL